MSKFNLPKIPRQKFNKIRAPAEIVSVFQLTDEGWRKLTLRWGLFFVFLAVANEVVWRTMSTDAWVNFKVFGIMPLTILFTLTQVPLISREQIQPAQDDGSTR